MTVVSEAEIGGQTREMVFAVCEPFERGTSAEPYAVSGDRLTGRVAKDAAEVVGRNRECAGQL
jgi:hypothetical protein